MTRRTTHSKKGFELSVGFIVILIITIIIFTSSLVVIKRFWSTTQTIQSSLSTDVQNQIDAVLGQGQAVAVVPAQVDATPGKQQSVGIGLMNVLKQKTTFYIVIGYSGAFDKNNELIQVDPELMQGWLLYNKGPYDLSQGKTDKASVLIEPKFQIDDDVRTKPGTYIYNVCVIPKDTAHGGNTINVDSYTERCGTVGKTAGNTISSLKPYSGKVYKMQVIIE